MPIAPPPTHGAAPMPMPAPSAPGMGPGNVHSPHVGISPGHYYPPHISAAEAAERLRRIHSGEDPNILAYNQAPETRFDLGHAFQTGGAAIGNQLLFGAPGAFGLTRGFENDPGWAEANVSAGIGIFALTLPLGVAKAGAGGVQILGRAVAPRIIQGVRAYQFAGGAWGGLQGDTTLQPTMVVTGWTGSM